jgi:hypothetical protein
MFEGLQLPQFISHFRRGSSPGLGSHHLTPQRTGTTDRSQNRRQPKKEAQDKQDKRTVKGTEERHILRRESKRF